MLAEFSDFLTTYNREIHIALEVLPCLLVIAALWRSVRKKVKASSQKTPWIVDNTDATARTWQQLWTRANLRILLENNHALQKYLLNGLRGLLSLALLVVFGIGSVGLIEHPEQADLQTLVFIVGFGSAFLALFIFCVREIYKTAIRHQERN